MLAEVNRLDNRDAAEFYRFCNERREFQLNAQRDLYLTTSDGVAIAYTEDRKIKQLLLSRVVGRTAHTIFVGDFGPYTVDMLDTLCAICSSREPIINAHEFTLKSFEVFIPLFDQSRLGRMRGDCSYQQQTFKAKINYPKL